MNLSRTDVDRIIRLLNESTYDSLILKEGDFVLEINTVPPASPGTAARATDSPSTPSAAETGSGPSSTEAKSRATSNDSVPEIGVDDAQTALVEAPMVGIFYGRPKPNADRFVDVGDTVCRGDTLCMIEVMKTYTPVIAQFDGKVIQCMVDDGDFVEFGQALFCISKEAK